jgi:Polyketide cyclase / dehydrase and lipid transport
MKTWTATTTIDAAPEAVLDVLTDPDAIARWAPLPFDVDDLDTPRLMAGSTARVSGRLAGRRVGFVVEVFEAEDGRLSLAATGPVGLDVNYDLAPTDSGSEVKASVSVRNGKGITGRLLGEATNALLSAGALTHAVSRLAALAACPA